MEQLRDPINNGLIHPAQNAALIYGVGSAADATTIVQLGLAQNIGWYYLSDNTDPVAAYASIPSSTVWDATIAALG